MMTSMCVDATTRAGADLGFNMTLVPDACAAPGLEFGGREVDTRTYTLRSSLLSANSTATVTPATSSPERILRIKRRQSPPLTSSLP